MNYPHEPREPSELKANRRHEARATCQHVNVITLYQFSDRDMPLRKHHVGGPFWCSYRNLKIFCIAAKGNPTHSTKLGLRSPSSNAKFYYYIYIILINILVRERKRIIILLISFCLVPTFGYFLFRLFVLSKILAFLKSISWSLVSPM